MGSTSRSAGLRRSGRPRRSGWRWTGLALTVGVGAVSLSIAAYGQDAASTDALTSHEAARAALERGVDSMGGGEALYRVGGVAWDASGTLDKTAERQGRAPDVPSPGAFRESLAVDPAGPRAAREYREDRYDGTWEWIREVWEGDDVYRVLVLQEGFAVEQRDGRFARERQRVERRAPGLLLEQLLETPATLRHGGRDADGRDVVTGVLTDGEAVTVRLDPDTGVLLRLDYIADLETLGDALVAWEWSDYAEVPGLGLFPRARRTIIDGRTYVDATVDAVATGRAAVSELFEVPVDIEGPFVQEVEEGESDADEETGSDGGGVGEGPEAGEGADPDESGRDASAGATLETLAPGVHRVRALRGRFHPLFVEVDDFVVAVDAPAGYPLMNQLPATDVAPGPSSAWLSERYLELIRRQVPDKPVRYVILTHFHNDHAGGVRAFVAEGATVLAAPEAADAVRELVEATPHTLAPDRLARSPRPLDLEVVQGSRTLGSGDRVVEVLDVGENPHTEQMLVVRLPREGILFVSDLLDPTARVEAFPKPSHAALDRWFAGWLERSGMAPERIYTMHGSGLVTPEYLARLDDGSPGVGGSDGGPSPRGASEGAAPDAGPASGEGAIRIVVPDRPVDVGAPGLPLVEPRPAVNPGDGEHLVVGAIFAAPDPEGPWHCAALASFDGGGSWTRTDLPVERCIDPWVVFTTDGVTAIEIGSGDAAGFRLLGFRSADGGRTWTREPEVHGEAFDHQVMSVASGGRAFMAARRNRTGPDGRPRHTVWVGRSDDAGRTFGPPMLVTDECASGIEQAFPGYPFLDGDPAGSLPHACVRPGPTADSTSSGRTAAVVRSVYGTPCWS